MKNVPDIGDKKHLRIYRGYSNVFVKYAFVLRVKWTVFIFHEWRSHE